MNIFTGLLVFVVLWWIIWFIALPIGVKTPEKVKVGKYELVFHVGEYFKNKIELKDPNFLDEVSIKFGISDPNQKYHVPLLFSPWSYSTYRGS